MAKLVDIAELRTVPECPTIISEVMNSIHPSWNRLFSNSIHPSWNRHSLYLSPLCRKLQTLLP
ncbi:hypothetical protein AMTR_s00102p00082130 [Amborella trichopoda]|uniref:Uncharacterized protein n=1 Tax=Amborella trichopoda TaxID=13333 RepID=W1NYZ7_AMBTC|nr:hypothetical protein AMTR_s00102p00082130 [Amborella trichopoda]